MRTPLNAIIGFSKLASEEELSPKMKGYIDDILSSGKLLNELIDDTLTISKSNSGKLKLRLEPVYSLDLFDSFLAPVRQSAADKNITLIEDMSEIAHRSIMADKLCLQKIFLNLLTNAIKYTPEGGHVWLRIYNEPRNSEDPDSFLMIKDDGIGVSPDYLPHIFEPFSQEKRAGYESGGTGLGLSIVKRIVDLMGGTIDVQSEVGKGTTFTVKLHFEKAERSNVAMVAIIGAGPAGITASIILALKGFKVTLIESQDRVGGVLRYGIPEFRLPKSTVDKYAKILNGLGVKFKPNTFVGSKATLEDFFIDGYKAVFVAVGTAKPMKLGLLGETLGHVHYAIDYLKSPDSYDIGKNVVIIGAGNVALDAARMAVRKNPGANVTLVSRKIDEDMTGNRHECRRLWR